MGHQIIKQPNGLFAVWSTIVDNFILTDATPEELIEDEMKSRREDVEEQIQKIVKTLNECRRYRHFMTWDEAINWRDVIHGEDYETNRE